MDNQEILHEHKSLLPPLGKDRLAWVARAREQRLIVSKLGKRGRPNRPCRSALHDGSSEYEGTGNSMVSTQGTEIRGLPHIDNQEKKADATRIYPTPCSQVSVK